MTTYEKNPQVILESYINGNLSWVKEQLKHDTALIGKVLQELTGTERENFWNWVAMW